MPSPHMPPYPHALSINPTPDINRHGHPCHFCVKNMDYSLENHASYIGLPASELPTPALVLSKPVLEHNTSILLEDVKRLGIKFRPHVKTLKVRSIPLLWMIQFLMACGLQCNEVTRMMLGNGTHRRIVASTLAEIRGALDLVKSGELDEVTIAQLPLTVVS